MPVAGLRASASRWPWLGAEIHPSGNATPNRNSNTGTSTAAATPPALNSSQRKGSTRRLDIVLGPQDQPGHYRRHHGPAEVIGTGYICRRHPAAASADHDCLGSKAEPGDRVQHDEQEGDDVDRDHHRVGRPVEEAVVVAVACTNGVDQQQQEDHEPRDEYAAQLPKREYEIRAAVQPPESTHALAVPPRVEFGVDGRRTHRALRGSTNALIDCMAALSLYRWMAPAGSTSLGHALVHSPTKVQPQTPSGCVSTSSRSAAP